MDIQILALIYWYRRRKNRGDGRLYILYKIFKYCWQKKFLILLVFEIEPMDLFTPRVPIYTPLSPVLTLYLKLLLTTYIVFSNDDCIRTYYY